MYYQLYVMYLFTILFSRYLISADAAGPIPNEVGQLVFLKELDLRNNRLGGERVTP